MYSKLVKTELDANKSILLPFVAIMAFFFIYLACEDSRPASS